MATASRTRASPECLYIELWEDLGRNLFFEYVTSTVSDANGNYIFDNLAPGNYGVMFYPEPGYVRSPRYQGGDAVDSNGPWAALTIGVCGEPLHATDIDAGYILPQIDLGTDSLNNGNIQADDDYVEAWEAKRIFVNSDDDDINGWSDRTQTDPMSVSDKDMAQTTLSIPSFSDAPGWEIRLTLPPELWAWGTPNKHKMPGTQSHSGIITWDTTNGDYPQSLHIEGIDEGDHSINVELFNRHGEFISSDLVRYSVETLVWPMNDVTYFPDFKSSTWGNAIVAGEGWQTTYSLFDYISRPNDKGVLTTHHPNFEPVGNEPTRRAGAEFDDSSSIDWYDTGTLEFSYLFDRRGMLGNDYGYVQASIIELWNNDRREQGQNFDRTKLSFVSNSGIKLGNPEARQEITILDVEAMVDLAGGIAALAFDPLPPFPQNLTGTKGFDQLGKLDMYRDVLGVARDFEDEYASQLMTGVLYGQYENPGEWSNVKDLYVLGNPFGRWPDAVALNRDRQHTFQFASMATPNRMALPLNRWVEIE